MDINATVLASAEVFDPASGNFRFTAGSMPGPRFQLSATMLIDGRVLIAGGRDQHGAFLSTALILP